MFSCGFPVFSSAPGGRCLERPVLNIGAAGRCKLEIFNCLLFRIWVAEVPQIGGPRSPRS